MKKIIFTILIGSTFLYGNKIYDISNEDYKKYKNEPEKMMEVFKNRFLNIKKEEKIEKISKKIEKNEDIKVKEKIKKVNQSTLTKNKTVNNPISKIKIENKTKANKNSKKFVKQELVKEKEKNNKKTYKDKKELNKKEFTEKITKDKKEKVKIKAVAIKKNKNTKQVKDSVKRRHIKQKTLKKEKIYSFIEVNKKLNYYKIKNEKNIDLLVKSINKILMKKNISYDEKEISSVLKNIKENKLSSFESQIYLEQIADLIKG